MYLIVSFIFYSFFLLAGTVANMNHKVCLHNIGVLVLFFYMQGGTKCFNSKKLTTKNVTH